jgi:murein tripeptide amidase MpaA
MAKRFFVTVIAQSKLALSSLHKYGLDLFQSTAQVNERKEFIIEGLLTLDEVGKLVDNGYKVIVREESSKQARARTETIGVNDWIKGAEGKLRETRQASDESAPPTGYLTSEGVESAVLYIHDKYQSMTEVIPLAEHSHEGRISRAIKISKGTSANNDRRNAVLFLGGVHAREIVNPDLLVTFALNLCQAYSSSSRLVFGGKTYDASSIKKIIEGLDIFIFPLVNPDGRVVVQSPTGDGMWRKNRNPNPGQSCEGVDINRNYDFLWGSGIGTSADYCSEVFKGTTAFSEPETRNVRHLIDGYTNIRSMIDVHSYSEDILLPWGDDDDQTAKEDQNFMNPSYDGKRGILDDNIYAEYIPKKDLDWYKETGTKMRDSIAKVRGTTYTVMEANDLYPTSGTSHDYAYCCHFVDTNRNKVLAYTLETGKVFQPPYSEAVNIISEVSAGLMEFCLANLSIKAEIVA